MRTRLALLFVAMVLAIAGNAEAQFRAQEPLPPPEDYHVELAAMLFKPTPQLTIDAQQLNTLSGSGIDFVKDFNIQNVRFTEFRGVVKPGRRHKILFSHVPAEYHQSTVLNQTITYKGVTFPVSVPATANLKWDLWRAGYEYDFVSSAHGFAGLLAELQHNHVIGDIASTAGSGSTDQTVDVPVLGLVVRGYVHRYVSITGQFSGIKVPHTKNVNGKTWDFDIYATGSVTKYLGIQAGYHSIVADYLVNEDSGNLKLKGPYLGGMVRF